MVKSLSELVSDLGRNFPADKIEEALKRLIERRYIVPASDSSAGTLAGYWASLGLPPGVAEQNLGNCRVRGCQRSTFRRDELGGRPEQARCPPSIGSDLTAG